MRLKPSPLVCKQAVELMTDYLEGALRPGARRKLERHLAGCDACSAYLAQIQATIAASGRVTPEDLSPETLDGLVDLFRAVHDDPEAD